MKAVENYDMNKELTNEELLYASYEDCMLFNKIIEGLPTMSGKYNDGLDKFGVPIPYHSGPHILRHFRNTFEIVKPNKILEIGFNMGHSSAMWLSLGDVAVCSLDVSEKDETIEAARFLEDKFDGMFLYFDRKYTSIDLGQFDLCFIDGAHDEYSIVADINLSKYLTIPYVLFDDWYPRYGETQKAVSKFPELELAKDMNNLRLYKINF
jgi:hypothetical protein